MVAAITKSSSEHVGRKRWAYLSLRAHCGYDCPGTGAKFPQGRDRDRLSKGATMYIDTYTTSRRVIVIISLLSVGLVSLSLLVTLAA